MRFLTVSDPLNSVDPKPAGWLDKDFFKVEKPKSISFVSTNAADSWSLTRESESGPWVLSNIKTGRSARHQQSFLPVQHAELSEFC